MRNDVTPTVALRNLKATPPTLAFNYNPCTIYIAKFMCDINCTAEKNLHLSLQLTLGCFQVTAVPELWRLKFQTISNDLIEAGSFSGVIRGMSWSLAILRRMNTT